jgi:hypothetical protein
MNARVLRFPAGGGKQGEVIVGSEKQLEKPWGICQDANGAIYVSDERRAVVLKFEGPTPRSALEGGKPVSVLTPKPKAQKTFAPPPRAVEAPVLESKVPSKPTPQPEAEQTPVPQPMEADDEKIAIGGDHNELD